ncbi:LCP family protein [Streptomyces sp. NPDC088258]|uniref:LCP family protein n=1 Tax=Streptomyces sp. NPDC088258 TaxID=3365849 RepID=UPI00382EB312
MTDSAGTPPEPDENAGSESRTRSESDAAAEDRGVTVPLDDRLRDGDEYRAVLTALASALASAAAGAPPAAAAPAGAAAGAASAPASALPAPRKPRKRRWLRWVAVGASVTVLAVTATGWWFYQRLDSNIKTDTSTAAELQTYEKERPKPVVLDAENILLVGSDSRAGEGNSKYGRDDGGSQRSDTTILLHLAADRKSATAVSFPRDLMVDIPSCRRADGTRAAAQFAQFNWAFEAGGAACTIRTVEKLTGIRVDHHMVVDFQGFKDMVDAVDGVEVCLKEAVDDKEAKLKLSAGKHILDGEQALGYVRARHALGDGSDTQRMGRQQRFLGALFKKVQSNGVLLDPTRLYPVLSAATKAITTDPGLGSLSDLYELTRSMRSVPTDKVQFLTVPRQPYVQNLNRDELVQPAANTLFGQLREDAPVTVVPPSAEDAEEAADSPADETGGDTVFQGTNAAAGVCE